MGEKRNYWEIISTEDTKYKLYFKDSVEGIEALEQFLEGGGNVADVQLVKVHGVRLSDKQGK